MPGVVSLAQMSILLIWLLIRAMLVLSNKHLGCVYTFPT